MTIEGPLRIGEQLLPLIQEGLLPWNETLETEIRQQLMLAEFLPKPSSQVS